jgi:xanthine/uracil permease
MRQRALAWILAAIVTITCVLQLRRGDEYKAVIGALLAMAFVLLASGVTKRQRSARYFSIALVGVAIVLVVIRLAGVQAAVSTP